MFQSPFDAIYRRSQLRLKAQKEVYKGIDLCVNVFCQLSTKSEKTALSSSGLHSHLYPSWHGFLSSASFFQVPFYKLTPFLLVFHGVDTCYWASPGKEKKNDMQNEMARRPIISTAPWSFLLAEARRHSLNTPLWHVRVIVISLICLQVTVGCTNITFLHLSEMLQKRKQRNTIHCMVAT